MNTNCRGLQREQRCVWIASDFIFADDKAKDVLLNCEKPAGSLLLEPRGPVDDNGDRSRHRSQT